MDTKYPESLSRILKQRDRRKLRREEGIAIRHRTQPITFSEIQEVDEENIREEDEARANDEFDSSSSLNMGLQSSKSAHDMSMNASQTPEVSPIPASPDSAGTDEGSNPPSGGGLADSFARLLNTPRTSI
ncbi:hypothetical protein M8J76_001065 [Diaphorina citri]|nr:hypothetical protein M8J76_001065 [Diaphorina citri]